MKEEKQKNIDIALAKLTEQEKELLGLIKKEKKPKVRKNYKLKVYYMIGDADGHTDEEVVISANNPFLPLVTTALDKLKACDGHWGIGLCEDTYLENYNSKNISLFEYELLGLVSDYDLEDEYIIPFLKENGFEEKEENFNFLREFEGLFTDETEYSFLTYQGYKLR
jgi:hypothetical protein